MRKAFALAAGLALVATACTDTATAPEATRLDMPAAENQLGGNGFPTGGHDYRLNIIGVPKDKTADMDNNNGRRIFVQLYCNPETAKNCGWGGNKVEEDIDWRTFDKTNLILLTPGDYGVLDANATDDDGATFSLPDPATTSYRIYARAHGKPGGSAVMRTCGFDDGLVDDETGDIWCSVESLSFVRTKGKQDTEEVTRELTTILIDEAAFDGTEDEDDLALQTCLATNDIGNEQDQYRVFIFSSCFQDYFWSYDNNGLKVLELRFYNDPTV